MVGFIFNIPAILTLKTIIEFKTLLNSLYRDLKLKAIDLCINHFYYIYYLFYYNDSSILSLSFIVLDRFC